MQQTNLTLDPKSRGFHLITTEIQNALPKLPETGMLNIFIQHTSAGLTINENADPSVRDDFETILNKLIPERDPDYTHIYEGDDDMPAHIKASLTDVSLNIPIQNGRLALGTWQGIYLCEFRNGMHRRKVVLTVMV